MGYSPQGRKESDTTEQLHFTLNWKEKCKIFKFGLENGKVNNYEVRKPTKHGCPLHLGVEGIARIDRKKMELVCITKHMFVAGEERICKIESVTPSVMSDFLRRHGQ